MNTILIGIVYVNNIKIKVTSKDLFNYDVIVQEPLTEFSRNEFHCKLKSTFSLQGEKELEAILETILAATQNDKTFTDVRNTLQFLEVHFPPVGV